MLIAACVLVWGNASSWVVSIAIWIGFAVGAYLITGATFAIFFAACVLAASQVALQVPPQRLYLGIALVSGAVCVTMLTRRFRQRIAETRAERWKNRDS